LISRKKMCRTSGTWIRVCTISRFGRTICICSRNGFSVEELVLRSGMHEPANSSESPRVKSGSLKSLTIAVLAAIPGLVPAESVTFEAEAGALGTNFAVGNSGGVVYISNTNNNTSTTIPGIPGRVVSYSVNFPAAGTYQLYTRVRVGTNTFND